ncbi:MAG: hypothetical protein U1E65_22895 [Myxococcota bacterium]
MRSVPRLGLISLPLLSACAGWQRSEEVVPVAANVTIYSAGGSVISGTLEPATLGGSRLRLPATAAAINLAQDGQSLKWFTVQTIEDPKKDESSGGTEKHKLVGLPALKPGPLQFNYALPEITWLLQLTAAIIDPKSVSLQLQAVVNMGSSETFRDCEVTLVLNNAMSVEKLAGATFNLSAFDLYPHRNITYNLDNKVLEYSFIREWNTYAGRDEVRVLLQAKNPFSVDLNQTSSSVEANRIIIESGYISGQTRPGELISLGAGIDDTIDTFRSVKITEALEKKALPFNHQISYEVSNRSPQEKTLRLVSSRVMGSEHRSVYHFKEPPDSTPENTLVWILKLQPGETHRLEYDYDADVKDVDGENGFEEGG